MVRDLVAFLAKVQADKALQDKMAGIIKSSTQENVFANCNAVAAEMGYSITQEDLQAYVDEHQEELQDTDLDKVAGGTAVTVSVSVLSVIIAAEATIVATVDITRKS